MIYNALIYLVHLLEIMINFKQSHHRIRNFITKRNIEVVLSYSYIIHYDITIQPSALTHFREPLAQQEVGASRHCMKNLLVFYVVLTSVSHSKVSKISKVSFHSSITISYCQMNHQFHSLVMNLPNSLKFTVVIKLLVNIFWL